MRYFFEDCSLDTDQRELRRGSDVVPTTPQVLDLLEYLIRSRDRVVSKDDLVNAIWNGTIVSDAALTTRLNVYEQAAITICRWKAPRERIFSASSLNSDILADHLGAQPPQD